MPCRPDRAGIKKRTVRFSSKKTKKSFSIKDAAQQLCRIPRQSCSFNVFNRPFTELWLRRRHIVTLTGLVGAQGQVKPELKQHLGMIAFYLSCRVKEARFISLMCLSDLSWHIKKLLTKINDPKLIMPAVCSIKCLMLDLLSHIEPSDLMCPA